MSGVIFSKRRHIVGEAPIGLPSEAITIVQALQRETIDAVICFSHLRWDFVYQRPQHLMSRLAKCCRIWFVEEPIDVAGDYPRLDIRHEPGGVTVVVPRLPPGTAHERNAMQSRLMDLLLALEHPQRCMLWFYTPMALPTAPILSPVLIVYDCMDELSAFKGAPASLRLAERALLARADLVFTGGISLYNAKRRLHTSVYLFPSSVDAQHFRRAREVLPEPADQVGIPHPRIGFFGVVDERFDTDLLHKVAAARPDHHFVIIGPIVKIDPSQLPRRANIHYLGKQAYADLPAFLAHWDITMMPFALNPSTRFISPTKTPEYLAGGRVVVSTAIHDVVCTYGRSDVVKIARAVGDKTSLRSFLDALDRALEQSRDPRAVAQAADREIAGMSWDDTFERICSVLIEALAARANGTQAKRCGS
jgi:hypothetical protein